MKPLAYPLTVLALIVGITLAAAPQPSSAQTPENTSASLIDSIGSIISDIQQLISTEFQQISTNFSGQQTASLSGSGSGLVAHYTFDEGSGTTAGDSAGSNDGTLRGNPSWTDGTVGSGALSLDGNGYVSIADDASLRFAGAFSISTWVNLDARTSGLNSINTIISKQIDFQDRNYWLVHWDGKWVFRASSGGNTKEVESDEQSSTSWQHLAITSDGSTTNMYVDGELQSDTASHGSLDTQNEPVFIGSEDGGTRFFRGFIDDVRIYNRALNDSEIAQLAGVSPDSTDEASTDDDSSTDADESDSTTDTETGTGEGTTDEASDTTDTNDRTFYIDYENGSDSNSGNSKSAPWKHVPAMEPFSGSYSHQAGDRFVFKGGVVWPNAALPLYITYGGSENNHDLYGVDKSWYKGGSWSRPVFDGQGRAFTNHGGNRGNVIWIKGFGVSGVTLDNIEIRNWVWNSPVPTSITDGYAVYIENSQNISLTNIYAHDWVIKTSDSGGGGFMQNFGSNISATNCVIKGPDFIDPAYKTDPNGTTSGVGVRGFDLLDGCDISGTSQGIWNVSVVRNNRVHHGGNSYNSSSHENAVWMQNTKEFYNNIIHDWHEGVGAFFLPGWGGRTPHRINVYNNVFFNLPQINLSGKSQPASNQNQIWFVNNTVVGQYVNVGRGGASDFGGPVVLANNLFVNNDSDAVNLNDPIANLTMEKNIVITPQQAAAYGLSAGNFYKPQSRISEIYNKAESYASSISGFKFDNDNTPRPQGAAWDIGAYELVSGGTPTPVNGQCGTTQNTCTSGTLSDTTDSDTHYLWECTGSNGGTDASCSLEKTPDPEPEPSTTPGDLNSDGVVNSLDWSIMRPVWGTADTTADLNNDGVVNSIDFSVLNQNWTT